MMSKIFFLFFLTFSAIAKENSLILQGTKNIPIELGLVLAGLQSSPMEDAELNDLKAQMNRIEIYSKKLTQEEIFFIAKSVFYKSFLSIQNQGPKFYYDEKNLKNLSEALNNTSDDFLKWLFMSLAKDVALLSKSPYYKDFEAAHALGKVDKVELKKIEKRVQLISWWIVKINPENPEQILKETTPLLQDILNKIEMDYYLLSTLAKPTPINPIGIEPKTEDNPTFFTIVEAGKKAPPPAHDKTVQDIIDSVILPTIGPNDLPKPTNEPDWLQDI